MNKINNIIRETMANANLSKAKTAKVANKGV